MPKLKCLGLRNTNWCGTFNALYQVNGGRLMWILEIIPSCNFNNSSLILLVSLVPTFSDHPNSSATDTTYYKNIHERVFFRPLTKSLALVNWINSSVIQVDNYFYKKEPYTCLNGKEYWSHVKIFDILQIKQVLCSLNLFSREICLAEIHNKKKLKFIKPNIQLFTRCCI